MLTCKDVAKAVAQDELDTGPWGPIPALDLLF